MKTISNNNMIATPLSPCNNDDEAFPAISTLSYSPSPFISSKSTRKRKRPGGGMMVSIFITITGLASSLSIKRIGAATAAEEDTFEFRKVPTATPTIIPIPLQPSSPSEFFFTFLEEVNQHQDDRPSTDHQLDAIPSFPSDSFSSASASSLNNDHGDAILKVTQQQCRDALLVADNNLDGMLSREEYVQYANHLSSTTGGDVIAQQYTTGEKDDDEPSFSTLPLNLKQIYSSFATIDDKIPLFGLKQPGETSSDDAQQHTIPFGGGLCEETLQMLLHSQLQLPSPGRSNDDDTTQPAPAPALPLNIHIIQQRQLVSEISLRDLQDDVDCTQTIPRQQCNTALAIADIGRDNFLDQMEYLRFINRLSLNAYSGVEFSDLPPNIQANFYNFASGNGLIDINGSKPGQAPTDTQDAFLDELCCKTDWNVDNPDPPGTGPPIPAPPPPPSGEENCDGTIPRPQCNTAITIADISRDNLMDQNEYVRFCNRLSGNEFAGFSFNQLPSNVIDNYNKFATTGGQIDVNGSKPGQTATPAQDVFLDALCCETDLALSTSPPPSPTTPTMPPGSMHPTFRPILCRTGMASSDLNRDDLLNQDEYVRFLNRLSSNEFLGFDFNDLPSCLQDNYDKLATTNGQIGIFGSKPGQSASEEQAEAIDNICIETAGALVCEPTTSPPIAPTPAPEPSQTPPPTFVPALCRTAVGSSDTNRDDYLDEDEYFRALNRLTRNEFDGLTYDELEDCWKDVYDELASDDNGQIYIFGAKPGQNADPEQEEFILEICYEISVVLGLGCNEPTPTRPPSTGGEPGTPTYAPGMSEVYNSFIVTNNLGIRADSLKDGRNREGLDRAYSSFAENSTIYIVYDDIESKELSTRSMLRKQTPRRRRRKLAVTFAPSSAEIYLLLDTECPDALPDISTCQTAYASYEVQIDDEDPAVVNDFYTAETQQRIIEGFLQTALEAADAQSPLEIYNASFPVSITFPPSEAPKETDAPAPSEGGEGDEEKSSKVGAIVGGIVGGLLFFVIVGYVSSNDRIKSMCRGFGGKGKVAGMDDDDEYGGNKDDDDASDEGGGKDEADERGLDNAFGDKQEKEKKGLFGKKNKQGSDKNLGGRGRSEDDDDNMFGFDPTPANNTFGDDKDDNQDFANYGFNDEPSDNEGSKRDGSERGGANAFGEPPSSPGWGNNSGGAGGFFGNTGFGNDDGEAGTGDNFFATSAFGESVDTGSNEGSGSQSDSGSESYTSSEDSTYESDTVENEDEEGTDTYGDEDDSYSRSSAEVSSASGSSTSMGSSLKKTSQEMDAMIEEGNWDGIAAAAESFHVPEGSSLEGSSKRSDMDADKGSKTDDDANDDDSSAGSDSRSEDSESGASASQTTATTTTEVREKRVEFRAQVEALVRLVMPDEIEKVDKMMEQFEGREPELVSTLQTMQERSATQRARAAVHKSKTRPERSDSQFRADGLLAAAGGTEGSAAGTAAIAAASLPIPAAGVMDDGSQSQDDGFDDGDGFGPDDEGSYLDEGSRSYYSEDQSQSYISGEGGSQSYISGEGSQSYISGEGGSQSYISGDGGSQSYISGDGGSQSYISGEDETYQSGDQSYSRRSGSQASRSYYSDEQSRSGSRSYYSHEGSRSRSQGSRSYYSNEDETFRSEDQTRSFVSGATGSQSQSFVSGGTESNSRSVVTGESGSQSYVSGDGGSQSYISGEGSHRSGGSRSYRSGDSRSYYSDEKGSQGSRSYYSGEGSQGSRSYYSGEDSRSGSRSYYSGEGSHSGSRSHYSGDSQGSRSQSQ